MEATKNRNIKDGTAYDHFFTSAPGKLYTVKRNASLSDTVALIPKVVYKTLDQTKQIAQQLKGKTVYETCSKVWHFVYQHIQYKKDEKGYEQIRSPRRTWHDRKSGVDCDCYSVFISSILTNLGIPHVLRITKYRANHFQHIYPIVGNRDRITLDCVTDWFNYEVPYTEKKDYPMDLQFLDGIPALYGNANDLYLMGSDDGMDELGKVIQRNMAKKKQHPVNTASKRTATAGMAKKRPAFLQQVKTMANEAAAVQAASPAQPPASPGKKKKKGLLKKVGSVAKKALNVVNKINPATLLLRNGLLAAMKLNIMRVAQRLRWGYLTPDQAAKANIDPAKFERLKKVIEKLGKIFYGAGGKPANLRKAILSGKGNKDKKVPLSGLDGLGSLDFASLDYMNVYTPLPQLLGPEIYYSENIEGFNGIDALDGLGELGEPVSAASIAAATGAVAAIAASLKQIGNIFKGKGEGAEDFDDTINEAAENNQPVPGTTTVPASITNPVVQTAPSPDDGYNENTVLPSATSNALVARQSVATDTAIEDEQAMLQTSSGAAAVTAVDEDRTAQEEAGTNAAATSSGSTGSSTGNNTGDQKESFWDKNKKWIKPVGIGVAVITVGVIGYNMFKSKNTKNKSSPPQLSGFPGKKKNHQRNGKRKPKQLQSVALI
ncbi:MAG: transglutaminase-like domain-containing protein [Chitinophagaceae bacterium]